METGKIVGLCVTFVACAVLGYLIPVQNFVGSSEAAETEEETGAVINIAKNNKKKIQPQTQDADSDGWLLDGAPAMEEEQSAEDSYTADEEEEAPKSNNQTKQATPKQATAPKQIAESTPKQVDEPAPKAAAPAQAAQGDTNNVPTISSAVVLPRNSKNYKLVGLSFVAKAAVASGDALQYELYEIGGSEPKYKSENGSFYNVYPVDGGKYKLVVRNTRTGDEATKEVSGFNKIKKLSASELQTMLNADSQDKLFYFNFDVAKLRFDCTGVDASEAPTTLDALLASRAAFGWTVQVVGTPKYDDYNRITYFKINLN